MLSTALISSLAYACAGLRVPDSNFIRSLCRQHGSALALTSANLSGAASTTHPDEFRQLWSLCAVVVDAGRICGSRAGSTVVDLAVPGSYAVVRPGSHAAETRATLSESFGLVERTPT